MPGILNSFGAKRIALRFKALEKMPEPIQMTRPNPNLLRDRDLGLASRSEVRLVAEESRGAPARAATAMPISITADPAKNTCPWCVPREAGAKTSRGMIDPREALKPIKSDSPSPTPSS
jgi:hypothetical protein